MLEAGVDGNVTESAAPPRTGAAIYFDGVSSRRRAVTLTLSGRLEIAEDGQAPAEWDYGDIRRIDSPAGVLRLGSAAAPPLARLEIRDAALAADLVLRCPRIDDNATGRRGIAAIVGWSLAAAASIVAVVLFALPLIADRLAPLVPESFEKRLGDVADSQVKTIFDAKLCSNAEGQQAFVKLVTAVREAAGLDTLVQSGVLSSSIPNAIALPGGKVYLFKGLLAKAENPDEIAGVLAHELGHLKHRDSMRSLIHNGGTSFLIGLLFGDITGSSALIFGSRTLITSSHSREAETNADTFAIEIMHRLGRPAKPTGELLLRITGKEGKGLSIISSHPLSEDRLARMSAQDKTASGPPLLTQREWLALKTICSANI